jgi:hypothetical protein
MGIESGPHFELASKDLARWLDERAKGTWWSVDGDPVLTGRLSFPAPENELAELLRRLDRPLLVAAFRQSADATGQSIRWERLDDLVDQLRNAVERWPPDTPEPCWAVNRFFWLSWKGGKGGEWMLVEDRETAKAFAEDEEVPAPQG